MKKVLLILLTLSSSLFGCQFFKDSPATAKLVVQYSVAKFAEQSGVEARQSRVDNIKRVALQVRSVASDDSTTIPLLKELAVVQLGKLHLSPADTVLASGLIDVIAEQLNLKIGDGLLKAEDKLVVSQVMDWVVEAATIAGAK